MKNKDIHCDPLRSANALPDVDAKNTVLFYHSSGMIECYNILDLYHLVLTSTRRWEDKDDGEINYKYPVFNLKYTGAIVDYATIGLAMGCGFNTIFLGEKVKRALYDSSIDPYVQLEEIVNVGFPFTRETMLTNNREEIEQEAKAIHTGGDLSMFTEEDFVDSNWSDGLSAPLNVTELRTNKEIKADLDLLEKTLRVLYQRNMINKEVREETEKRYRKLIREAERTKALGHNVLFVFAD